jgi:hypothetical protein
VFIEEVTSFFSLLSCQVLYRASTSFGITADHVMLEPEYSKGEASQSQEAVLITQTTCYNKIYTDISTSKGQAMTRIIHIGIGKVEAIAELNNTRVAQVIWEALPFKAEAELWGEEIYFPIPVYSELEDGQINVKIGDLGYWPQGNSFCIFFGPTPISQKDEIRPVSAVTVFGRIIGDATIFKSVKPGAPVNITRHDKTENE